jgi:hypothetical protein
MQKFKKVLVICPGGVVTGGPEAMHYLTFVLRKLGVNAFIVYTPFTDKFNLTEAYSEMEVPIAEYEDEEGSLIIFPEINPMLALSVKKAKAAIWWLSVDNFLERRHLSQLRDRFRFFKKAVKGERPLGGVKALKNLIHFSQSEYSGKYLQSNGLIPIPFYEPINQQFLRERINPGVAGRVDEILFNPVKGKLVTDALIQKFPNIKFTALKGFDRKALTEKLGKAKLYIDFGHHPGRDRMPREAAMHGCCIVTGILGSAQNMIDVPIEAKYKLDSSTPNFLANFEALVDDIFINFPKHYETFEAYRRLITDEPKRFQTQLEKYFLG